MHRLQPDRAIPHAPEPARLGARISRTALVAAPARRALREARPEGALAEGGAGLGIESCGLEQRPSGGSGEGSSGHFFGR